MVARWGWPIGRVVLVLGPFGGVVDYVLAYAMEVFLAADDVFVVVALPDRRARCATQSVDAFSGAGFEGVNDQAEGVTFEGGGA